MHCLEQRFSHPHDHAALPLALGELGIVELAGIEGADHAPDTHRPVILIDANLDELRAPGIRRVISRWRLHVFECAEGLTSILFGRGIWWHRIARNLDA